MDGKVLYRTFRTYAGPMIKGTVPLSATEVPTSHVARAFWLTAKVETGAKFGAIVMYDGTAVTAGLDQHIAVYPKELKNEDGNAADDQGGFWKLLRRLEVLPGPHYNIQLGRLWDMLKQRNWYLAQDGVLRYLNSGHFLNPVTKLRVYFNAGDVVYGYDIRDHLTPLNGVVPKSGTLRERADEWAQAVHQVFVHDQAHRTQIEFGQEHMVTRMKSRRLNMGTRATRWSRADAAYLGREISSLHVGHGGWHEEIDLALSVYQSHSVNAPTKANQALARAMKGPHGKFPANLIKHLGNNAYGRWDDDLKTGRYQRTRSAALASKLWPRSLFTGPRAIMPKDLPG